MKRLSILVVAVALASFATSAFADGAGSQGSFRTRISDNTSTQLDPLGSIRYATVNTTFETGANLQTVGRVKVLMYVKAGNLITQGDLLIWDTTVRRDTTTLRVRALTAIDSGSVRGDMCGLGQNRIDTSNFGWITIDGPETGVTASNGGVTTGRFLFGRFGQVGTGRLPNVSNIQGFTSTFDTALVTSCIQAIESKAAGESGLIQAVRCR